MGLKIFKFAAPIYDPSVIVEKTRTLAEEGIIRVQQLNLNLIEIELSSVEAENKFLEIANTCLLESIRKNDF